MTITIFYVEDANASARFYETVLGRKPVEASPSFAMFALDGGAMLGLWSRSAINPTSSMTGGGGELTFKVADVDAAHADWVARGVPIAQPPVDMEFGRNFLALDPDHHRLRVFTPAT